MQGLTRRVHLLCRLVAQLGRNDMPCQLRLIHSAAATMMPWLYTIMNL